MRSHLDIAHDLYDAFERQDSQRLVELLHPDFVGYVTEGMPGGVGGAHFGPKAMLSDVWAPIARRFGARPVPDQFHCCDDGDVIVLGSYPGQSAGTDRAFDAVFAHALAFRDNRIIAMRQVTDSQRWVDAVAAANVAVVKRMFDAVEQRDAEALLSVYAEDVVITEASSLPYGGVYHGHEGAIKHGMGYVAAWDSVQTAADRELELVILSAGNPLIVRWRQRATKTDGTHLDAPVVDMIELRAGRVTSLHMFHFDTARVLEFLNAAPAA